MTSINGSTDGAADEVGTKPAWQKAKLPVLTASTTAEAALAEIVLGCVEHLRGNEACVLAGEHAEGIHQMRVATRRLRSCLDLYRQFIPSEQLEYLTLELKWLIGELGPARDWDVFLAEVFAPVMRQIEGENRLAELAERIERHRAEAYARAQTIIRSQRYLGLVLLLHSWAEGRGWRDSAWENAARLQSKAAKLAHDLLTQIYAQLSTAGQDFEHLDAEQRHTVRIALKKLRYATEFFCLLFSKPKTMPYLATMKALQDDLGTSNDVEVARKLLKRVISRAHGKERARLSYAAGLVVGWHSRLGPDHERKLIQDWHRFVARPPFWRTDLPESQLGAPADSTASSTPRPLEVGDAASPASAGRT